MFLDKKDLYFRFRHITMTYYDDMLIKEVNKLGIIKGTFDQTTNHRWSLQDIFTKIIF